MAEIKLSTLSKAHELGETKIHPAEETELTKTEKSTELSPEERKKVDTIKSGIDFMDTQSMVQYGIGAQKRLMEFSDDVLQSTKSKDGGAVGDLLSELVIEVKSIEGGGEGFLEKLPFLKNSVHSLKKLKERYTKVEVQVDRISAALEKSGRQMLKDIQLFDQMYQEVLDCFRELELYICAGKERIAEIRTETLPQLRQEATEKGDPMSAQLVHDFEDTIDRFERKIYDLELSRTIAIQSAPQIKLIQNNDRILVDKIQTAILHTIPIWKSQFVIAVGLSHQQQVLEMQREITDTTNQMLLQNAQLLKTNTVETARESNRGIVDIETLQKVNQNLISTIEETIQIQRTGREKRQAAETELGRIETELKQKLLQIREDVSSE